MIFLLEKFRMGKVEFILTVIVSMLLSQVVSVTYFDYRLDRLNNIVEGKSEKVNILKTAIAICLQRNGGNYIECNSGKNGIPVVENINVVDGAIRYKLNLPELSYINMQSAVRGKEDAAYLTWDVVCTGNLDIIYLDYYDSCNLVVYKDNS